MPKKKTQKEFLAMIFQTHGDKYDYSKVYYDGMDKKIIIICKKHGEFQQEAKSHLRGTDCPRCIGCRKTEDFIEKAINKHGNKYDYSKSEYMTAITPLTIICRTHGEFQTTPNNHLSGYNCAKCAGRGRTTDDFIKLAKEIHGNKYVYDKTVYKRMDYYITIICKEHGEFEQTPSHHIYGKQGCSKCGGNIISQKKMKSSEDFLLNAKEKHGEKFDYSKSIYLGCKKNIIIICKIHGEFQTTPDSHINAESGCPKCTSSKGENAIRLILQKNKINFEEQKSFDDCKDVSLLKFDFYIPNFNLLIEFDGIQHFKPVETFGGEKSFLMQKRRDQIKNKFAEENKISLLRIFYNIKFNLIEKLIMNSINCKENIRLDRKCFNLNKY